MSCLGCWLILAAWVLGILVAFGLCAFAACLLLGYRFAVGVEKR